MAHTALDSALARPILTAQPHPLLAMWRIATGRATIALNKPSGCAAAIALAALKPWTAVAPVAIAHSARSLCLRTHDRLFHSTRSMSAGPSAPPTAAASASASSAPSASAPKPPDRVSSWLLRELEDAARAQQWATIEVLWERLAELKLIPDSVQQLTRDTAAAASATPPTPPLNADLFTLPELRRVFTVLAYTALRTGDVDLLQHRLFAVVSAEAIDSLELVRSPTIRHALLWSYYLSKQWQAAVSMRDLAQQLGCDAPDRDATGLDVEGFNAPVYAEMMIECLSRCCGEKDAVHLAAKEAAVSKLVSFAWVSEGGSAAAGNAKKQPATTLAGGSFKLPTMGASASAATASSPPIAKPSSLRSSRTDELHSLYNTIDKEEVAAASHGSSHLLAEDAAAGADDSLDVSAALRDELCGITRNKLMTLHWADKPYDKACPVQTAVHEQAQREAAVARAVMHGLPPPSMTHFPRSLQRPLLHVMLHHYSSTAALSGSVGLLLRCLTVLEPAHGTPDVQIQMAPWSPPESDDDASAAAARASLFVPPPPPSLFATFTWSSQAAKSAANRIDPYSPDPEQGRRVRERQTAASVWSSHLIPSVFSRSENASAMHSLARLWASVLDLKPAQLDQLWKPAQPHVALAAALLTKLKAKLTPPPRASPRKPQISLKQALLRMQSPFRNRYDDDLPSGSLSSNSDAASDDQPPQQQLPPLDSMAHRQYRLIRNLLRHGEAQQDNEPTLASAATMARMGEMA